MRECANVRALVADLQVSRQALSRWKDGIEGTVSRDRSRVSSSSAHAELRKEIADLKIALPDKTMEVSFLERCLAKSRGASPQSQRQQRVGVYDQIAEMTAPLQGSLAVERMCTLAEVSRAGFYRWLKAERPEAEQVGVRSAIHEIGITHHRNYGYRRIPAELRICGMLVNHKRVLRLMQVDNLLALRNRRLLPTTDSTHECQVFLTLAKHM